MKYGAASFALISLLIALPSVTFGATASAPLTITLGPSGPSALANGTYVITLGGSAVDGTSNPPLLSGTTSLAAQQWIWDGSKFDNVAQRGSQRGIEFLADGGNSRPLLTNTGDPWLVTANGAGWNLQDLNTGSYLTVQGTGAGILPNGNYQFSTTNGCITIVSSFANLAACGSGVQSFAWNGGTTGTGNIDGFFDVNSGSNPEPIGFVCGNLGACGDTFTITAVSGGYTLRAASGPGTGLYIQDSPFGLGSTATVWTISGQTGGSTLAMVPSGTQTPTVWTMTLVGPSATITPTSVPNVPDTTGPNVTLASFTCTLSTGPACSPTSWSMSGAPSFMTLNSSTGAWSTNRALASGDVGSYASTVSDGSYGPVSVTLSVASSCSGATITVTPTTASSSASITIDVANGAGYHGDWVGIYTAGAPSDDSFISWDYTNGTQTDTGIGSPTAHFTMTAPSSSGSYDVRLLDGTALSPLYPIQAQTSLTVSGGGGGGGTACSQPDSGKGASLGLSCVAAASDDFTGSSLDTTKWTYGLPGGNDGTTSLFSPANCAVSGGNVIFTTTDNGNGTYNNCGFAAKGSNIVPAGPTYIEVSAQISDNSGGFWFFGNTFPQEETDWAGVSPIGLPGASCSPNHCYPTAEFFCWDVGYNPGGDCGEQPTNVIGTIPTNITSGSHVFGMFRNTDGFLYYYYDGALISQVPVNSSSLWITQPEYFQATVGQEHGGNPCPCPNQMSINYVHTYH